MKNKVQRVLERYGKLKAEKNPWLPLYQILGEYVMTRKQNFTADIQDGEFLTGKIFDNTAGSANHLMASSMIGALWPNSAKTFFIGAPLALRAKGLETQEVKDYYERVTQTMAEAMDHPKAGLLTSLEEYMNDQGVFGISGVGAFENTDEDELEVPVRYTAVDAKKIAIDEGKDGFVDTVYIEKQMTVRQLVQEYGVDNVSKASAEAFNNGRCEEKVVVVHAIETRVDGDPYGFGNADMPVASMHIEKSAGKKLRESGFTEMPVFITRFWKAMGEKYGRSPAMEALPDILEANALREATIIAIEKALDPPLAVFNDGTLGGGVIDTSAGAINVFNVSGRIGNANQKPIEQLVTTGELNSSYTRIAELREIIKNNFFIDRLLDLNNETRMTLGEANIRNELRGQSLGTVYARQIAELFTRLIERTFNIMLSKGLLGVLKNSQEEQAILAAGGVPFYIPDAVADLMMEGKDVFKITFISPAARIMKAEELLGIQRTVEFAIGVAAAAPEILDNLDLDQIIRDVQDLTGAPSRTVVSLDTVRKIRESRQQQQQAMLQMQAQQQQAETARATGQAAQAASQAGIPVAGGAEGEVAA